MPLWPPSVGRRMGRNAIRSQAAVLGGGGLAVPQSAAGYVALGLPSPEYIWDCQVADVPLTELVTGTDHMADQAANSDGITYSTDLGLAGVSEVGITRTTENTSRALIASTTALDVGTTDRVAFGIMMQWPTHPPSNKRVLDKRPGNGYYTYINASGYPGIFGRPASGGDVNINVSTEHPVDTWHYILTILDRDAGEEKVKIWTQLATNEQSIAGDGSYTAARGFGFAATGLTNMVVGAVAAWEGASVGSLTTADPAAFLAGVGL